jgi:hypothetical protein
VAVREEQMSREGDRTRDGLDILVDMPEWTAPPRAVWGAAGCVAEVLDAALTGPNWCAGRRYAALLRRDTGWGEEGGAVPDRYEVVIIGTGAGGGTLAYALAPTGKRTLLLERGEYLAREKANWDPGAVFADGRYKTTELWHDAAGHVFRPEMNYSAGGNTKVYGAASLRMRKRDCGEVGRYDGISPAWPLAYQDSEPY